MDISKKITKLGLTEWTSTAEAATTEELKAMIVTAEGNMHNIDKAVEINEEILRLKEELKQLTAPFKESKDIEKTKITYIIQTLEGRGVEIGV